MRTVLVELRPFRSIALALAAGLLAIPTWSQTIRVDITPGHSAKSFVPTQALGAGVDRISTASTDKVFTEPVMKQVLSAGWQPVSYRQNTELHVEAWHWNPAGKWSEGSKGYFVGDAKPGAFIRHSFGYALPHRGFTRNEGTDANGFSVLTDGDESTYWKSNPYLSQAFTGEDDANYPQWVLVDLAHSLPINAIRISWAEPYARRYLVQYWSGNENPVKQPTKGAWVTFRGGDVRGGSGGKALLQLDRDPLAVRYLRIWMTESSNTCDDHGAADRRDCVGYAIRELYLGTTSGDGTFHDLVRHTADPDQTLTLCSSVDPWHEPSDVQDKGDQVGMDLFYTSGYTRGLPAMIPISLIYGTPEDSVNQIAYLEARGYPISYVEMGEEPDGQYMQPEDYGALYLQWAAALHKLDPKLKLGGPVFEGVNEDILVWPDAQGRTSWMGRFLAFLKAHNRMQDLSFMSFEHYPYDPCTIQWSDLYDEPALISHILQVWRDDGLPPNVPMIISELNMSSSSGESFVDNFGSLWLADFVGSFFEAGGDGLYFFHYIPEPLDHGCGGSMSTFSMFAMSKDYQIQQPTSQYFASQLINLEWAQPGSGTHQVFRAGSDIVDPAGHPLVTAYAVHRPDGQWALMIVNKDQENSHSVRLVFEDAGANRHSTFAGQVDRITFGSEQYRWNAEPNGGSASPDGPPMKSQLAVDASTKYLLPKASVTVLRGQLTGSQAR